MSAIKYCDTAKQLSNQEDKQSLTKQKWTNLVDFNSAM